MYLKAMETLEIDPLTEFYDSIKNLVTKDRYEHRLGLFFRHLKLEGDLRAQAKEFTKKAKSDLPWTTIVINEWIRFQKERAEKHEIEESTIIGFYKPIKLFCEENNIILNWKKIARRIPRGRKHANDRAPTIEEIIKVLHYPDRRIRPIVLIMESSGCRIGAFDYFTFGDIQPIKKQGKLIAAKIVIYRATNDEYFSFITPEAYEAVEEYKAYRIEQGEKITSSSPLIRNLIKGDRWGDGEPHIPLRLKASGVKRLVEDALKVMGVRGKLEKGKRRHPFQADHGFRKYFKTICEKKMKSLHVEMLLGHTTGLGDNYYKPKEEELLSEYLKSVSDLSLESKPQVEIEEDIEELKQERDSLRGELQQLRDEIPSIVALEITKILSSGGGKKETAERLRKEFPQHFKP